MAVTVMGVLKISIILYFLCFLSLKYELNFLKKIVIHVYQNIKL